MNYPQDQPPGISREAFECKMCGKCCEGKNIAILPHEAKKMAKFLGMPYERFMSTYCEITYIPTPLGFVPIFSLKREDNRCIFLREKKCSIYPVRPGQCRLYPLNFSAYFIYTGEFRYEPDVHGYLITLAPNKGIVVADYCPGWKITAEELYNNLFKYVNVVRALSALNAREKEVMGFYNRYYRLAQISKMLQLGTKGLEMILKRLFGLAR